MDLVSGSNITPCFALCLPQQSQKPGSVLFHAHMFLIISCKVSRSGSALLHVVLRKFHILFPSPVHLLKTSHPLNEKMPAAVSDSYTSTGGSSYSRNLFMDYCFHLLNLPIAFFPYILLVVHHAPESLNLGVMLLFIS